jgi:hypothetical protein
MSIESKLLHKVDVTNVGGINDWGEKTAGTTTTEVPCFIDGRFRRIPSQDGEVTSVDFSILFLPDADVGVGYTVANGVDKDGNALLAAGRIVALEDWNHPRKGRRGREAFIARN